MAEERTDNHADCDMVITIEEHFTHSKEEEEEDKLLLEQYKEFEKDMEQFANASTPPSPPTSPPTAPPSPPPPPPLPTLPSLHYELHQLQEQIEVLEKLIMEHQLISITGISHLKSEMGQNWKDKVYTLFFEARIPLYWILDIVPDEDNPDEPDIVYVYFINYHVKNKVNEILPFYLENHYNNNVLIM
jgi:hypothetical protein